DVQYTIQTTLADAGAPAVVPRMEDRKSALLYGTVIKGDGTILPGAELKLRYSDFLQSTTADTDGHFLFEYVPRDPDNNLNGNYLLEAAAAKQETTLSGSVRLLHTLHQISVVFLGRGSAKGIVRYDNG